jgi:hypothetical protein
MIHLYWISLPLCQHLYLTYLIVLRGDVLVHRHRDHLHRLRGHLGRHVHILRWIFEGESGNLKCSFELARQRDRSRTLESDLTLIFYESLPWRVRVSSCSATHSPRLWVLQSVLRTDLASGYETTPISSSSLQGNCAPPILEPAGWLLPLSLALSRPAFFTLIFDRFIFSVRTF